MNILMKRFSSTNDATLGVMSIGDFKCFTVEDEPREEKIAAETRIPAGTYQIKLRNEGGMTKRYAERYGALHKGMLWLQDVPNFEWIYIHTGNTDDHSEGCILPNMSASALSHTGSLSRDAYLQLYPMIANAILDGELVTITIIDLDGIQ